MVTQSTQHIRRTVPLRVKLAPDMAARLKSIAEPRGVTSATLAALIVGEYVERAEREVRAAIAAAGWRRSEPGETGDEGEFNDLVLTVERVAS
jgi:predicted transcriptional regulator